MTRPAPGWLSPAPASGFTTAPSYRRETQLLCLPTAGYGLEQFRWWPEFVGRMRVRVLRLPGDVDETWWSGHPSLPSQAHDLVEDLLAGSRGLLTGPFSFFGHASSALIAYEALRLLAGRGLPTPELLVVSACGPPHRPGLRLHGPVEPADLDDAASEEEAVLRLLSTGASPMPSLVRGAGLAIRTEQTALACYRPGPLPALAGRIVTVDWRDDVRRGGPGMAGWARYGTLERRLLPGAPEDYARRPVELLELLASL